ncbi:hypothetical protein [Thermogemmatispora tikiterensis]|uniref:hypothetical protein n=1 Tax=Thermogemmatispora tikiterensis TaxID=1825093 RepID=UPI00167C0C7E|nr:hypothetical protein [Thermogemmatispora tikiterensis]
MVAQKACGVKLELLLPLRAPSISAGKLSPFASPVVALLSSPIDKLPAPDYTIY